jgi:hypothetical protein
MHKSNIMFYVSILAIVVAIQFGISNKKVAAHTFHLPTVSTDHIPDEPSPNWPYTYYGL